MASKRIEWSVNARLDLLEILEFYIERNKSAAFSIKLNKRINKSIKQIATQPTLGIQTDIKFVRTLITGDYQIIYEIYEQLILIIMIWDCRQNPDKRKIQERVAK